VWQGPEKEAVTSGRSKIIQGQVFVLHTVKSNCTMGNLSDLHFVPASGSTTPIDWTHVPEASKKALTECYGYNWETDDFKPLPTTVADLAKMFDKSKFFGYLDSNLLTNLMDISEFGLQATTPTDRSIAQVGPRFYMKYINVYEVHTVFLREHCTFYILNNKYLLQDKKGPFVASGSPRYFALCRPRVLIKRKFESTMGNLEIAKEMSLTFYTMAAELYRPVITLRCSLRASCWDLAILALAAP
jgi:hypothetical protein